MKSLFRYHVRSNASPEHGLPVARSPRDRGLLDMKALLQIWILFSAALLPLSAWAVASPQSPPPHAPAPNVEDLVNVQFRTDVRLFTVMAALNASGYDFEAPGEEHSGTRSQIRSRLQSVNPELLDEMRAFYRQLRSPDPVDVQSAFVSLALLVTGPPEFAVDEHAEHIPADVVPVARFAGYLPAFYEKARVDELWEEFRGRHQAALASYRPILTDVIRETLEYFRVPARIVLDRRMILIPDLLNFKGVVNARNLEREYIVVLGPANDPADQYAQLQHEYLHFLVDPLIEKFSAILLKHREIEKVAFRQPHLSPQYRDRFLLVATESLIEAIQMRLHPPEDSERQLAELFSRGLVLAPSFHAELRRFESIADEPLTSHVKAIFESIKSDQVREWEDLAAQSLQRREAEAEEVRSQEERARADFEAEAQRRDLLNEAGGLLASGDLDPAREKIAELLRLDPENGSAHFYLAQIHSQQENFPLAFEHYQKAARSDAEPWIRAWAVVRMGKFLAYQGREQEARKYFQQVLALGEDLRGARQEAENALAVLNSKP